MARYELSDDATASISGSDSSYDAIAAFNEKFSLQAEPDFRLKLTKRIKDIRLAANLTVEDVSHGSNFSDNSKQSWHFTIRPAEKSTNLVRKLLHKVAVFSDQRKLAWSSDKMLLFKFFHLQLGAEYDWLTQTPSASYQLTTKWSTTPNNAKYKRKLLLTSRAAVVGHMHLDYKMPQVQGGFGPNQARSADVDEGSCHMRIPRLDLQLSLDKHAGSSVQPLWARMLGRRPKEPVRLLEAKAEEPEAWEANCEAGVKQGATSDSAVRAPLPWCLPEPWKLPWLPQQTKHA